MKCKGDGTTSLWRRYSEFELLRNYLEIMYPAIVVPPLPEKKVCLMYGTWENNGASSCEKGTYRIYEQRRLRRACASVQSHQSLGCSLTQYRELEEASDKKGGNLAPPDSCAGAFEGTQMALHLRSIFSWVGSLIDLQGVPQSMIEPCHEIMVLFFLRKLILQTHKCSHPIGLDVWFLVGPFIYFHTSCVQTAKALARLRRCAGSPEPSLVAYVFSTIISWAD